MKNSFLKILCLAVGLTLGLVLLAKVCFIEEFDSCIPDRERVYTIVENFRELGPLPFALSALFIYAVIEICVALRAYKTVNENPARNLKSE